MRTRLLLIAAAMAAALCCQESQAQYQSGDPGYASAGFGGFQARSAGYQSGDPGYASAGSGAFQAQPVAWQDPVDEDEDAAGSAEASLRRLASGDACGGQRGGASESCESCGGCKATCGCSCAPSWQFYGDFLALRPRDAEVVYAVPFNGPVTSPPDVPIQIGRLGMTDYNYEPAFRVGFTRALNDCASLGVSYTMLESSAHDGVSTVAPYVVRSMVSHPSTLSANSDGLDAVAAAGIDFDLIDLDFRGVILCSDRHTVNYLLGARYAYLEQGFFSRYAVNGEETVTTDLRFEGGGIRIGLEGERYLCSGGLMVYGRGVANFVAGQFDARYWQDNVFSTDHVVQTRWQAGRLMSILELEIGGGWTSPSGRLRLSGGYLVSSWQNAVKTDDFILAVRGNNFVDLGDALTFDGVVARIEYRW